MDSLDLKLQNIWATGYVRPETYLLTFFLNDFIGTVKVVSAVKSLKFSFYSNSPLGRENLESVLWIFIRLCRAVGSKIFLTRMWDTHIFLSLAKEALLVDLCDYLLSQLFKGFLVGSLLASVNPSNIYINRLNWS